MTKSPDGRQAVCPTAGDRHHARALAIKSRKPDSCPCLHCQGLHAYGMDWLNQAQQTGQLLLALALALPIAIEREKSTRLMGLRTFPLVAMATCGFTLIGQSFLDNDNSGGMARIVQGIITGIGFIGGGAILKIEDKLVGTATAASVWLTSTNWEMETSNSLPSADRRVTFPSFTSSASARIEVPAVDRHSRTSVGVSANSRPADSSSAGKNRFMQGLVEGVMDYDQIA